MYIICVHIVIWIMCPQASTVSGRITAPRRLAETARHADRWRMATGARARPASPGQIVPRTLTSATGTHAYTELVTTHMDPTSEYYSCCGECVIKNSLARQSEWQLCQNPCYILLSVRV